MQMWAPLPGWGLPGSPSMTVGGSVGLVPMSNPPLAPRPEWYEQSRQRAAAIQAQNWQPATMQQRERVWGEYNAWSWNCLGKAGILATPGDLLVYFESYWLHQHGRQHVGEQKAAPASLDAAVSHLSTRFAELGRRGMWDPVIGIGNPCQSMELRTFKGGYHTQMASSGHYPRQALPLAVEKYQVLLDQLMREGMTASAQTDGAPWYRDVLLWRDALMVGLLWASCRRPAEVGQLPTASVQTTSDTWSAQAVVSKMSHPSHGRRKPRAIQVHGWEGTILCLLMEEYLSSLERHQQSLGQFLFSPLRPDKLHFDTGKGLSTSAISKRVVGHLKRLGMYAGESVYSLKRGALQHAFYVEGKSLEVLGEAADIDTPGVVQQYLRK
jgi:hypothetical protein